MDAIAVRPPALDLRDVATALGDAGVPVVVLRGGPGDRDAAYAHGDRNLELLVPKSHVAAALRVLEPMRWRYAWLRTGLLRLLPREYFWWDGGTDLALYWGVPLAPLPGVALRPLTTQLWQRAERTPEGFFEPEAAALLVYLAVQACRPGRGHEDDWNHFLHMRSRVLDWTRVREIARTTGVSRAVDRALAAAEAGADRPGAGPLLDGPIGLVWRLAIAVQRRAPSPRMRRILAGSPSLGDATMRCRLAGVEVLCGPGVFVPTPDADIFVEMALKRVDTHSEPNIVEIGTGCGAIALALAHARSDADVHGTDVSSAAVLWARRNARRLRLERTKFYRGSLLDPLPADLRGRMDVMIANLPFYPAAGYAPIGSVPRGTIQGSGEDGLDLVRQLARDARAFLRPGGLLLLQMFGRQWETLSLELMEIGYRPGVARTSGPFAICPVELLAAPGD